MIQISLAAGCPVLRLAQLQKGMTLIVIMGADTMEQLL